MNFVKFFLKYLVEVGGTMRDAISTKDHFLSKDIKSSFNYGLLLKIEPKSLLAIMVFILKCEEESEKLCSL